MSDIISIADLLVNQSEHLLAVLAIAAILIAIVVCFAEYKTALYEYITNRRNKWWFI